MMKRQSPLARLKRRHTNDAPANGGMNGVDALLFSSTSEEDPLATIGGFDLTRASGDQQVEVAQRTAAADTQSIEPSPAPAPEPPVAAAPEPEAPAPETTTPAEAEASAPVADTEAPADASAAAPEEASPSAPEPASAPTRRKSRVKTTLLGFDRSDGRTEELFKSAPQEKARATTDFPTGWLVITSGPGRGTAMALQSGVSLIGRDDDQTIQLDFGDNSISRSNHAAVAYDAETRSFYLGHGGKTNIVRLNGAPVLSTETLQNGDQIRVGETTLSFVGFCNENFCWSEDEAH
ncbi:FHA domain protein [Roseovarius aestuarii]|uniref:FHA domain protein n=3 Tax=Roseovarius aestuarii TaxID=475083 RepID=A0A1X7BU31_9RHOB|nr:FHA domain protein [Roseovarius aestuarii]